MKSPYTRDFSPSPSSSDPSPIKGEGRDTALRALRTEPRFPRTALFVTAGLLIWAADFLFIYVFAALACARGYSHETVFSIGIVPFVSAAATAIAAAASLALLVAGARRARAAPALADQAPAPMFLGRLAATVAMLALIAIAFTGVPGFLVRGVCEF